MSRELDFADPAALGAALIERCGSVSRMDSIVRGAHADWGIEIGGKVFRVTIEAVRSDLPFSGGRDVE